MTINLSEINTDEYCYQAKEKLQQSYTWFMSDKSSSFTVMLIKQI